MKAIEERLRIDVALYVDVGVRMAVSRQEFLDAKRAGGVRRSNQHDVALAVLDDGEPAHDERAHQDVAQLAVGLDNRTQALAIDLDDFAGHADAGASQAVTARQDAAARR